MGVSGDVVHLVEVNQAFTLDVASLRQMFCSLQREDHHCETGPRALRPPAAIPGHLTQAVRVGTRPR